MSELAPKECIPCKGGVPKLEGEEFDALIEQVGNGRRVADEHHLEQLYKFDNFRQALDLTTRVGEPAENS